MGYATIVSGGDAGRYTITMDFGESTRLALLAALSLLLVEIDIKIAAAQSKLNEAEAKEAAAEAAYQAAVQDFIDLHAAIVPGSPRPDDSAILFTLKRLRDLQLAHQPLRVNLSAVKLDKAIALKRVAYWNGVVTTNTRQAWCTDYTEDAAPGQVVATMEIPGDDNLIVIAAGARAWAESDGYLAARELMSPEQAFFNAAIFPGWQIDKPTYRWGTVTAIDEEGETLNVTLAAATSSAQRLNVNRETALAAVPVDYMGTGSALFEIDDRVVVQFIGQSWATPRVVGFLDNPRPPNWTCVMLLISAYFLKSRNPALMASIFTGAVDVECKLNGGAWQTATMEVDETVEKAWVVPFDNGGSTGEMRLRVIPLAYTDPGSLAFGLGPNIQILVAPSFPEVPGRPLANRNIAEFRIRLAGQTVFNAACTDVGFAGEGVTVGYVKTRGGINIGEDITPNASSMAVQRLTYTLTG